MTLFCDDDDENNDHHLEQRFKSLISCAAPANPHLYEAPKFKSRDSIVCQVD